MTTLLARLRRGHHHPLVLGATSFVVTLALLFVQPGSGIA